MQVLHVCSEMFPLLKTGGLADVIGALPAAQIADGVIVGSAIVRMVGEQKQSAVPAVGAYVRRMKQAISQ